MPTPCLRSSGTGQVGSGGGDKSDEDLHGCGCDAGIDRNARLCPEWAAAKRHQSDDKKTDQPTKKVDDKAYKAALERIPEPKEKYDPWGVARPAPPDKKTK